MLTIKIVDKNTKPMYEKADIDFAKFNAFIASITKTRDFFTISNETPADGDTVTFTLILCDRLNAVSENLTLFEQLKSRFSDMGATPDGSPKEFGVIGKTFADNMTDLKATNPADGKEFYVLGSDLTTHDHRNHVKLSGTTWETISDNTSVPLTDSEEFTLKFADGTSQVITLLKGKLSGILSALNTEDITLTYDDGTTEAVKVIV